MEVRLIAHTPQPEKVVAVAAKLCYSDTSIDKLLSGLDQQKSAEFVKMLAGFGHDSPTEHVSFTFAIEGVSRSLLAQITRHRMASFSVQSQRYVQLDGFEAIMPPEVEQIPQARDLFLEGVQQQADLYKELAGLLEQKHMRELLEQGESPEQAERKAQKMAIEDARFVLPNGCETKMIVTMNARSLKHFFRLRCCNRAQWEIQQLADMMLRLVYRVAPSLFAKAGPGCGDGGCTEGKMTCGKAAEVRKKYRAMREEVGEQHG